MPSVFISYTVNDQRLVESLARFLRKVFPKIDLRYSGESAGGGPPPGSQWFGWIVEQVKGCNVTLVVLTASSVQKPWPMWEAGAVAGASYGEGRERPIVPVRYGVPNERMPDPLRNLQSIDGSSRSELKALVRDTLMDAKDSPLFDGFWDNSENQRALGAYVDDIQCAMLALPIAPTEAAIGEWCERLDRLHEQKRSSEAAQIERWIAIAFGTRDGGREFPLDVRIHRRLSEMYLAARDFASAIRQLRLARELAPRDIFVLRALAEALLKSKNRDGAKEILDAIRGLDARAFEENAECAGLLGRWFKEASDWRQARDSYQRVLDLQPSYYMADNVGQLSARIGELDRARQVFQQARDIIGRTGEASVWSLATLANAAVAIGDESEQPLLEAVARLQPDANTVSSILEGLGHLRTALRLPEAKLDGWRNALAGRAG